MAGASGYGYLELDTESGRRGPRFPAVEEAITAVTGAEAGFIATNNAAALLLAVGLAGRRGSVAVSRGELVEIGGGVRIPEIVARAGARLVEVGTTNRTRADDFEVAIADGKARVVLRVHPSNFEMHGFTEEPDPGEVASIAHRHGAIVIDDLGSGALLDTAAFGLAHEPMPAERLAAGADVVLFSGDKLVGGPQAGILAGRRDLVERMRRDPLARAVRPDKAILAAVATTLGLYRAGRAVAEIPVWRMIARDAGELRERAGWIVGEVSSSGGSDGVRVVELRSAIGGGSLPGQTLPSAGVGVRVAAAQKAAAALRTSAQPILVRVDDDELLFDLRTVDPLDDAVIADAIRGLLPEG
jgi:L-seryl-tRNA(Ser) seleniumtransferase